VQGQGRAGACSIVGYMQIRFRNISGRETMACMDSDI
jgi:hypothetical protein